eukprot:m.62979 g.62979  ORF g.62979 m.62979 type:complete len:92 (-) comp11550_c0_seq4:39-314(-)
MLDILSKIQNTILQFTNYNTFILDLDFTLITGIKSTNEEKIPKSKPSVQIPKGSILLDPHRPHDTKDYSGRILEAKGGRRYKIAIHLIHQL